MISKNENYSKIISWYIFQQCNSGLVYFNNKIKESWFLIIEKYDLIYWKYNPVGINGIKV